MTEKQQTAVFAMMTEFAGKEVSKKKMMNLKEEMTI